MRFLYLMDPLARVHPEKDTTYAFVRAAQARGHEALHAMAHDLFLDGQELSARTRTLRVMTSAPYAELGAERDVPIADIACVFVRKDPPFDDAYLYATLLLEHARGKTVIINDPRGLREANEKLYATHFPAWMPRFLVSSSRDKILDFVAKNGGKGVLKPLHGAGGIGVLLVAKGDPNARSIIDTLTDEEKNLAIVQEYLPAVRQGDKRIFLLDGQILGAINRVPRADDLRSNIHVGGVVEKCDVTEREREMIAAITPKLLADGLIFVGLDVIGERLTEINVTSPTGIQELSRFEGRDVAADVIAWVEQHA